MINSESTMGLGPDDQVDTLKYVGFKYFPYIRKEIQHIFCTHTHTQKIKILSYLAENNFRR